MIRTHPPYQSANDRRDTHDRAWLRRPWRCLIRRLLAWAAYYCAEAGDWLFRLWQRR